MEKLHANFHANKQPAENCVFLSFFHFGVEKSVLADNSVLQLARVFPCHYSGSVL